MNRNVIFNSAIAVWLFELKSSFKNKEQYCLSNLVTYCLRCREMKKNKKSCLIFFQTAFLCIITS
jgi:hypothetical protein